MQETNRTASFYQVSVPALRPFLVYSQLLFGVEIRDLSWNAPYVGRYQGIVHNARFRPKCCEIAPKLDRTLSKAIYANHQEVEFACAFLGVRPWSADWPEDKYDKVVESRGPAHIAAARDYFSFIAAGRRRF